MSATHPYLDLIECRTRMSLILIVVDRRKRHVLSWLDRARPVDRAHRSHLLPVLLLHLLVHLALLLLRATELLKLGIWALQVATRIDDVEPQQRDEHGHRVEDVLEPLVRQDGVVGVCALTVLRDAEDDSDLCEMV